MKKRNLLSKLWLKYTNKTQYKIYKWELKNYSQVRFSNFFLESSRLNSFEKIKNAADNNNNELNVAHGGNAGDIIYSLPVAKKIHELTGAKINYFLQLGKPLILSGELSHPMGNVMLNKKMAEMIIPLISSQHYINSCQIYHSEQIHVDFDYFRSGVIPLDKGNIGRWCSYLTGVSPDLWKSWLNIEIDSRYSNNIVIARSGRYRNSVDYSFLGKLDNLIFVGVKSEYIDIQKSIPDIKWVEVDDFYHLAQVIASCKLFIGNQSFPYSIAEALKAPRLLETCFEVINVVPEGPNGHDFFFQEHFESLVKQMTTKDDYID